MEEIATAPHVSSSHRVRFFSFPAAILAIIAGKAVWTCRGRIADTDLWWHLRNAEYIVFNGRLPGADMYSFTAAGSAWLDHSWLSEVIYYTGYRALGLQGIMIIFTAAVALLGVAMFRLCMMRNSVPLAAGIAAIFGFALAMVGFTPRAQNFGWLCFMGVFAILFHYRHGKRAPLWLVPILFCLWINLHGSWPMGLAVFAIVIGAGWISRDIGKVAAVPWTPMDRRRLLVTFGASVAALFVNPLAYRLVLYPLDVAFNQKLNLKVGPEWASVDFNDERGAYVLIALLAVFAFSLISTRPWRMDEAALAAFALYCGLTHIRFLVLTGIVLPVVLVRHFGRMSTYERAHERTLLNGAIILGVLASAVFAFPSEMELHDQVRDVFPVAAADYLKVHPVEGYMFNQYEWGGYLEWALPQSKAFIDSRTDIFERQGVLKDYVAIAAGERTEELLDRHRISYVIFPTTTPLSYFLSKSPRWRCFYQDRQAIVYRRSTDSENIEGHAPNCT
jgi:hypothetical protein